MSGILNRSLFLITILFTVAVSGCVATTAEVQPPPVAEAPRPVYTDPFEYCQAAGTIDAPDEYYIGAEMPDSIVQAMIKQNIVSADAPQEFQQNAVWRCMNHSVWVCHYGANLPCLEKADKSTEPSTEMEDFCAENPDADVIPAAVMGRATVYEWGCSDGESAVGEQIFSSDLQGFLAEFWYELPPE